MHAPGAMLHCPRVGHCQWHHDVCRNSLRAPTRSGPCSEEATGTVTAALPQPPPGGPGGPLPVVWHCQWVSEPAWGCRNPGTPSQWRPLPVALRLPQPRHCQWQLEVTQLSLRLPGSAALAVRGSVSDSCRLCLSTYDVRVRMGGDPLVPPPTRRTCGPSLSQAASVALPRRRRGGG